MSATMPACGICIEDLDKPVALPCGHLFCSECIGRAANAIVPYTTLHVCPMCRSSYSIANIDTTPVPAHLRSHLLPSIRRLYPDIPNQAPRTVSATTEIAIENSRLNAENSALQTTCGMWRRRAEVHGAATLGLLGFARMARDQAVKMRHERDDIYKHYKLLREKLPASELSLYPPFPSPSTCADLPPLPHAFTEALPLSSGEEGINTASEESTDG
ncbi:hypothetical protein FPV67DRAFT_617201 [Lyophyllum atratum]|nr:hypothetical protein FPV67DRAFT_617201 [Lyophyllum atratum]